jgi:hypothetical protein
VQTVKISVEKTGALDQCGELPVVIADLGYLGSWSDFAAWQRRHIRPIRYRSKRRLILPSDRQFGRRYLQMLRRVGSQCDVNALRGICYDGAAGIVEDQRGSTGRDSHGCRLSSRAGGNADNRFFGPTMRLKR